MKKEKKSEAFPWKKVFVIAVGVLFVAMMVLSAMGSSWLSSFRSVMANDSVTIDYTITDLNGQPVLTSDQNLYQTSITRGYLTFLTQPLTVRAGYTGNPGTTGVDATNYYVSRTGETVSFGILGQELDQLDVAVLGMKTGDTKTIRFDSSDPLILTLTKNEFTAMGGNFTKSAIGDLIPIGISETPIVEGLPGRNSTPTNPVLRIGIVINKTESSIEVQHLYPTADITVKEFK
jgi:FKBP-type peptidyl-prolyl cis-trans isomerase 2